MKSFVTTVVVVLLFFLALVFGARNEQLVTISYFVVQGEYRLPIVLAIVFLLGFLISWFFAIYHIARLRMVLRNTKKKLTQLEAKLPKDVEA